MDKKVAQVYLAQYVGLKTEADHMEQIADEELKSVQQPRIDASKRKMAEIRKAVESIDDPLQRTVLHARYIDCRNGRLTTWPQIALQIYGSNTEAKMKATYRLHNKALEALPLPDENHGKTLTFFGDCSEFFHGFLIKDRDRKNNVENVSSKRMHTERVHYKLTKKDA